MNELLNKALNDQIALEQASARAYRQLAIWADANDFSGAALWLGKQASEETVATAISELYALAQAEGDFRTIPLLTRFLEEQVEEEASARTIIAELEMVSDSRSATLMLDRELPSRRAGDPDTGV